MRIINKHEEDEMEFWHDYKETDVRFPEYKEDQNGECITYFIGELISK